MFSDDDLLPISALQHLVFCQRQCALIHIEGLWAENRLTAEGQRLHRRVHEQPGEARAGVRIARGLALRSRRLGLTGKADAVEFHATGPFPVEYKRGRPKPDRCDEVQLCAQAMCLEEMLGVDVPAGALFYGKTRRRQDVAFDPALRALTERIARRLHELVGAGRTPPPDPGPKCRSCSLRELCLPDTAGGRSAERYVWRMVAAAKGEEP